MAFRFKCAACGSEIITLYLKVGERAECKACKKKNIVPDNAAEIDNPLKTRAEELADLGKRLKKQPDNITETAKGDKKPLPKEEGIQKLTCGECGVEQQSLNALFCFKCGTDLYPKEMVEVKACSKCNRTYDLSYNFCDTDGSKLELKEIAIDTKPQLSDGKVKQQLEKLIQPIKEVSELRSTTIVNPARSTGETSGELMDELPMKWYNFVLYGQIPLGIIVSIFFTFAISGIYPIFIATMVLELIIIAFLFYSLYNKTTNSWRYLLFMNCISIVIRAWGYGPNAGTILGVLIVGVIYLIPNYKYFNRRKHLFVN